MSVPRRAALAFAALGALLTCAPPTVVPGTGAPEPREPARVVPPRVVFLGSSTTAGSGASRPERRWTSLLSRRFGWIEVNRGLSSSLLTEIAARKVASGEERWRGALDGEPPDAVVVMYGANDVLARVPLGDPATPGTFRHAAFAVLRGMREALPDATLIVLTPQPNRATAEAREPYDLALAEAAAAVGARFLPAGAAFPDDRLGALGADRLHLNDAGHAALAAFLADRPQVFALPARTVRMARAAGAASGDAAPR